MPTANTLTAQQLQTPLRTEFAVDMHCDSCSHTVTSALSRITGITNLSISIPSKTVTIESTAPPSLLFKALRSTGLNTVLRGQSTTGSHSHLGAAVCIFESFRGAKGWAQHNNKGLARLVQVDGETCLVDVTIDGVTPGEHVVSIHECGDISGGCESTGKALTELGKVMVDASGRGDLVVEKRDVKVWDIIGRSIVIDAANQKATAEAGKDAVCGIIARSAGVFENPKSVCSCDGKTLWEEANTNPSKM
ncbi:hypothetical protein PhCBS80983_g04833 [Powellomyces hirtus]|uniref:Superoxide dismutase 1 copper chaperone n=1 Tax=Powellomyces hirtus TaxID=109895 RepID=A0A507DX06_9FUNG|nr:hypothetical protein PhCBS80983_g04833 [Powellomyces hirtus]